jgi:hypothetical protein
MKPSVLVAIPTIDRDLRFFPVLTGSLRPLLADSSPFDVRILVLIREQDQLTFARWQAFPRATVARLPDYPIEGRHNLAALADKRNHALEYAARENLDFLFFLDSDVIIREDTLPRLYRSTRLGADISTAPCPIRSLGCPAVGLIEGKRSPYANKILYNPQELDLPGEHFRISVAGLACALIDRGSFDLRCRIERVTGFDGRSLITFEAEDIGFYLDARDKDRTVYCLTRHMVQHCE